MISRVLTSCVLLLIALLLAGAQPLPEDCFLSVRVLTADGKPLPVAPQVTMYRLEGTSRIYAGRRLPPSKDNISPVDMLVPGRYEVNIMLPTYGLVDGPKTVDVLNGPNDLTWTLPALIPVGGDLLLDGKPAPLPAQTQVYLINSPRAGYGPNLAACSFSAGKYTLQGAFPGSYQMLVMTEKYCGYTTFTVPADAHGAVSTPVSLLAGGAVTFNVTYDTDTRAKIPLYYCTIVCSGLVKKTFPLTLLMYSDQAGKANTLTLPPGTWKWSVRHPTYQPQNGTITIAPGVNQTVAIDMTQDEKIAP